MGDRAVLGGSGWDTSLGEAIPIVTLGAVDVETGENLAVLGASGYDTSLGRQLSPSGTPSLDFTLAANSQYVPVLAL